jgi:sn-glycerol 3-phosphate transport system permease protein
LVLLQLMIMPDVLIVENYRAISALGLLDTIPAIGLPYLASAFAIFLLRQTLKSIPQELVDAARVEGAGPLQILWRVRAPHPWHFDILSRVWLRPRGGGTEVRASP